MPASSVRSTRPFFSTLALAGLALVAAAVLPTRVLAQAGSVWTTDASCVSQDLNVYSPGSTVYVRGSGFSAGQIDITVTGQPGSGDPDTPVWTGSATADASGEFCVATYVVDPGDFGVYKVNAGGKNDNYTVAAPTPTATATTPATATATATTPATATATAAATSSSSTIATPTATQPAATPTEPAATPTAPAPTATQPVATPTTAVPTATASASQTSSQIPPPAATSAPGIELLTSAIPPAASSSPADGQVQAFAAVSQPASQVLGQASSVQRQADPPAITTVAVQALPSAGQGPTAQDVSVELLAVGLLLLAAGLAGIRVYR